MSSDFSRHSAPGRRVPASTFASIVAIAADGIITVDAAQLILFFNEGAEHIFGWRADEVLGQHVAMLIPERFRGVHEGHVRGFGHGADVARRMGERSEISGRRRDGEEFPAEASISRVTVEGETVFTVVIRDITDRKRIADRLRFLAEAGETLAAQQGVRELAAVAAQLPVPLLADACTVQLASDAPVVVPVEQGLTMDERARGTLPTPLATLAVPLYSRGETLGVLTLRRARPWNDAERALAEDYARRAALALDAARLLEQVRRALRLRDDVTGIVSHDLRNPVQAIKMLATAIGNAGAGLPPDVMEHASVIHQAAEQMDRLIQDLLDAARVDAGQLAIDPRPRYAGPVVASGIEPLMPLARARGLVLGLEVEDDLPPVMVDAGRIAQVLSNLVGNAIKFTPTGGRVTLSVAAADGDVVVRVRDTGPGIPDAQRERIFDRWVQLRSPSSAGAGLGLPIARGIVEAHGGRLWHEAAPGGGSVFAFTLRRAPDGEE